ncbi:endo-1,3-beta-glucanase [Tothia fuscella]|uniref:glucan endo-1,3-beta-D-glucosidase n=1 Tax=Tothia fuscella TaxID=1048955 RepID=A0A9P4NUW3_9PEZI|nr:endo-1,3-beta-glucanase [Tothia fuscella]
MSAAFALLLALRYLQVHAQPQDAIPGAVYAPAAEAIAANLPTETLPVTRVYTSGIPPVQSTTTEAEPGTTGDVHTSLDSGGRLSAGPFDTSRVFYPSLSLSSLSSASVLASSRPVATASANIFASTGTNAPPQNIGFRSDHKALPLGVTPQNEPLHTNKFYANLYLGNQSNPVWTHPYSVVWAKGGGNTGSWGFSVSHVERDMISYGQNNPPSGAAQYFVYPVGIQDIVLSATELSNTSVLTTDSHQAFSVNANFAPQAGMDTILSFPLVQGMGFVTALYDHASVILQSGVYFQSIAFGGGVNNDLTWKYRIVLSDNSNWLLYVTPKGAVGAPLFTLENSTTIIGPSNFQGTVQVAKNPAGPAGEEDYDEAAGAYPIGASVVGSVKGALGSYKIKWKKAGQKTQSLLMFALPHHVESMVPDMDNLATNIQLTTTTKGMAKAYLTGSFKFIEPALPVDIGFDPWTPARGTIKYVSETAATFINVAASVELAQDIDEQSNLNSMYYSGKALSKFALIVYAANSFGDNSTLAASGLKRLQSAFAIFVNNQQIYPLAYDTVWKGVVSSATYSTNDPNQDFGNSFYNDHHFHYGYFVHAAAVIGYLDPDWLDDGTNKDWVNTLVRDYANGVEYDPYFPFSRSFDWYHGHSWAKGLFESSDGKDEESTSEDTFASYAMKMWGHVIGDANMEARGNLQLAILARSLRNYFLMTFDNTVQPPNFIGNKVTGILFENKADHTTYFGSQPEFIQGIHMIPISPITSYIRSGTFVSEEWGLYFANRNISAIQNGWSGILMANLATIDPRTSWQFFADPEFDVVHLDGGASLTWYLTWAACLGGI